MNFSSFLFARPSFLTGIARLVDLFGVFDAYNVSSTPAAADTRATAADWMAIGADFRTVMNETTVSVMKQTAGHPRQLALNLPAHVPQR